MKNFEPALFLVLIQMPCVGVTVVLGWSASGIREESESGADGPRVGNKELNWSASGFDTIIRLESRMLESTSSLAGWKLFCWVILSLVEVKSSKY